jgi:hypothetical protein
MQKHTRLINALQQAGYWYDVIYVSTNTTVSGRVVGSGL